MRYQYIINRIEDIIYGICDLKQKKTNSIK